MTLPDRSGLLARPIVFAPPSNDPQRLARLRAQEGHPRVTPPTVQAVLGGGAIQPGREQEAVAIWQSLRARAAQNDVMASEDITALAMMLAQLPGAQPEMQRAVAESTYDAAVLPRHKQEQLGRIVRRAVAVNDRTTALQYLSWMVPDSAEIESDSEYRLSSSAVATLDRDPQRVLQLLGERKDAIPMVDSLDAMASVFRANAFELQDDEGAAAQVLRELPEARSST